jgi:acyl-CoA reductase-like NAD-dependent aldehyde dehydrogenase
MGPVILTKLVLPQMIDRNAGVVINLAGVIIVNAAGGISPTTPFGGYKGSGFGREGGRAGIEEMVHRKTVLIGP